jgi:uncharacterized protein (TIGR02246 family)
MTNQTTSTDRDLAAIGDIPMQMVAAWNRGDGDGFAAPFTDTADFVAFEGSHLEGRDEIAAFHRQIFATVVHGTQLEGGVRFVRLLGPDLAVMHAWARYANLPGRDDSAGGRLSMQLYVIVRTEAGWRVEAMLNARQLTPEQQDALDEIESAAA